MQLESAVRAVLFQLRVCLVEPHCKHFVHFLRAKVDRRIESPSAARCERSWIPASVYEVDICSGRRSCLRRDESFFGVTEQEQNGCIASALRARGFRNPDHQERLAVDTVQLAGSA